MALKFEKWKIWQRAVELSNNVYLLAEESVLRVSSSLRGRSPKNFHGITMRFFSCNQLLNEVQFGFGQLSTIN